MEQSNEDQKTAEEKTPEQSNVESYDARMRENAARVSAFLSGPAYAGAPEYAWALALVQSETFLPSSPGAEREMVTCQRAVQRALGDWGRTLAPYEAARAEHDRLANLCRRADGMLPFHYGPDGRPTVNPILDHYEAALVRADEAHSANAEVLDDVLTIESAVCIREALTLAGVTDSALQEEICRCVLRGGEPFDGGGVPAARRMAEWRAGREDAD